MTIRPLIPTATLILVLIPLILAGCKKGEDEEAGEEATEAAAGTGQTETFDKTFDFDALEGGFHEKILAVREAQQWSTHKSARVKNPKGDKDDPRTLIELEASKEILEQSFTGGSNFLVNWQIEDGAFRYMYDWLDQSWVEDDHQVRQAAALWGIALCHQYRPSREMDAAMRKGFEFWFDATIDGPMGTRLVKYRQDKLCSSGTVALVSLSIVDYLLTEQELEPEYEAKLKEYLEGYLAFLQYMQLENGRFSMDFRIAESRRLDRSSPYYDGETLLCLTKAARQLGYTDLVPTIETAAMACAKKYTIASWRKDIDSKTTKGFYQWGSMSYVEYAKADWKDAEVFKDVTLALGWWMCHTHETLRKNRNHAYAVEGEVSAYRIAQMRGDMDAMIDLLYVIDRSLYKLTTWQIGGPLAAENEFLVANPSDDPMAVGGVMNARKKSKRPVGQDCAHQLRIDVTQHQMHAVTMALETIYDGEPVSKVP